MPQGARFVGMLGCCRLLYVMSVLGGKQYSDEV